MAILETSVKTHTLIKAIQSRKDSLIGHILLHEGPLKTITEVSVEGINVPDRQVMLDLRCNSYA